MCFGCKGISLGFRFKSLIGLRLKTGELYKKIKLFIL